MSSQSTLELKTSYVNYWPCWVLILVFKPLPAGFKHMYKLETCKVAMFKYPNICSAFQKTWLSSLRTKFKMERAKLRDVTDVVKEAREKFGRKRRSTEVLSTDAKRCCRVEVSLIYIVSRISETTQIFS